MLTLNTLMMLMVYNVSANEKESKKKMFFIKKIHDVHDESVSIENNIDYYEIIASSLLLVALIIYTSPFIVRNLSVYFMPSLG